MAFTYNLSTDVGKVRLQIPDKINSEAEGSIFEDEELQVFLDMPGVGGDVLRASAYACRVIARDEARIQKVQKILDIQTDGAKLSAEFRAHAKELMAEADRVEEGADDGNGGFATVKVIRSDFQAREARSGRRRCR